MKTIDVYVVVSECEGVFFGVYSSMEEALTNADEFDLIEKHTLTYPKEIQVQRDY